jgi:predicted amidohydrolase
MPRYDCLLYGGRVLDPANARDGLYDIGILHGQVEAVEPKLEPASAATVFDMTGKWVMPGHIDTHVHVSSTLQASTTENEDEPCLPPAYQTDPALGYRMMAEAGVTTAIDFAGTMPSIIDGIKRRGAGLNIAGLHVLAPGATIPHHDPSRTELREALRQGLKQGSLGLKILGGHYPLTPEATARAIAVCNEATAYVALHCGTTASSSTLDGLREVPELVGDGRLHVAHVDAYCRGLVREPIDECQEALSMLSGMKRQLVSEVKFGIPNACSGRCDGADVRDHIVHNCLRARGYPVTRDGLRQAFLDGYASVIAAHRERMQLFTREDGLALWEAAGSHVMVSFPVNNPASAFTLTTAKDAAGEFIVDAVSTDGGCIPRNIAVKRTWALVDMEALSALEMASKLSWNPACMFGFTSKGHLSPGADADITAINPETGTPVFGMVAGEPIMRDGHALGQGGTLLVTRWGETTARESGLDYRIVDLSKTKLYADWPSSYRE